MNADQAVLVRWAFVTCVHEAGHGVTGILLGLTDCAISLTRNGGRCRPGRYPNEAALLTYIAAGQAAEDRLAGYDALHFVKWSPRLLDYETWPPDAEGPSDAEAIRRRAPAPEVELAVRQRAAELVEVHLSKIIRVAQELFYAGRMIRQDILDVLAE